MDDHGEKMTTKKCSKCFEVQSLEEFSNKKNSKDKKDSWCSTCHHVSITFYRNTEEGFLKTKYGLIKDRCRLDKRKCYFTVEEFLTAFYKHKSIYGMRSFWGPGVDHLDQHLPITMIYEGNGKKGQKGVAKGSKRIGSNLSVDRLDSTLDYTLQNLIFIRFDENARKNSSSYEDCKIQIRIHDERFINMKAI